MDKDKISGVVSLVRSAVSAVVMGVILHRFCFYAPRASDESMLSAMVNSGDGVLAAVGKGIFIILIAGFGVSVLTLVYSLILTVLVFTGRQDDPLAMKMMDISSLIKSCLSSVITIVMGIIAMIFPIPAALSVTDQKWMYVILGIFEAVGIMLLIHGIRDTVHSIRAHRASQENDETYFNDGGSL